MMASGLFSWESEKRDLWAVYVAAFFHLVGLVGIILDLGFVTSLTPYNLLLTFFLIVWSRRSRESEFYQFLFLSFSIGWIAEWIGVNTGVLFGQYHYSRVLGLKIAGVPVLIGINWFIVMYSSGAAAEWLVRVFEGGTMKVKLLSRTSLVVLLGATLAVLLDWLMEPVAVMLGYWEWLNGGSIPASNYQSWFIVSYVLIAFYRLLGFDKGNKFPARLYFLLILFFVLIRIIVLKS
ncbi:MAG: carotenoid biosynthesis protein [Bacteroidetes bacterium]|nr:carotenoid biosynthesis protein [Bacteroidota bacterium]